LNRLPADVGTLLVALGLNVDAIQPEGILIDDAVDPTVVASADPLTSPLSTSVPHREEELDDGSFEEVWMALAQSIEQFRTDVTADAVDAVFYLLHRFEVFQYATVHLVYGRRCFRRGLWPEGSEQLVRL